MTKTCTHLDTIRDVTPSAKGCEECLKSGSPWVHLRICRTCGHVGCCDDSPNRHATKHFRATAHPIIEGYDAVSKANMSSRNSSRVCIVRCSPSSISRYRRADRSLMAAQKASAPRLEKRRPMEGYARSFL